MSPNTERDYRSTLAAAALLHGPADEVPPLEVLKSAIPTALPPQQVSDTDAWGEDVKRLWPEFGPSYASVKRFCARERRAAGPSSADVSIPVETAAGEVAQVDFGYVGKVYDPDSHTLREAWVFVMVLGHSRHQPPRTARCPSAWARCDFPTPAGPMNRRKA